MEKEFIGKYKIEAVKGNIEGYTHNAQVWLSLDNGKDWYYCGIGRFTKSLAEAVTWCNQYHEHRRFMNPITIELPERDDDVVNEFFSADGSFIQRTSTDYLKYENKIDIAEFKAGRIFPVRSLYDFAESVNGYNPDDIEEEVIERMKTSGRCEADEIIHYLWETAKYPSIEMADLDRYFS